MRGNVESVACGQYHTIVTTKRQSRDMHVFGDNKHGQLGFFPETSETLRVLQPVRIPLSDVQHDVPIQIHAGWSHVNVLNGKQAKFTLCFCYYIIDVVYKLLRR